MKQDWKYKKMGEVCVSELGKTLNSSKDTGELHPYLCAVNVLWDKIDLSTLKETRFEEDELERYSVKKGDLLVCEGGDVGRAAIWNEETVIQYQNALHRIRFNGEVIPRFCLFYLRHLKDNGTLDGRYAKGVTIKHLVKSSLLSIPIPVPSIEEQRKICSLLDKMNRVIEAKKEQLKELDNFAQAIFYDMFGDILESAPTKILKDVADYYIGLTYSPTDVAENGTVVLRSSNIQNNVLDFEDTVRVNMVISDKKIVQDGDILMCARNGSARLVGKVARIKNLSEKMSFGAFMTIIRSPYNDFLFQFFLSHYFRNQLTTSKTATINQITTKMLDGIRLNVPSLEQQQAFAEKVEAIERQKELINQSIKDVQTLFDAKMDYYFGD